MWNEIEICFLRVRLCRIEFFAKRICLRASLCIFQATCYPAPQFREKLADPVDDMVAVTGGGLITTSKGPGTALLFALELGEQLFGKDARDKIQKEMLV